MYTIVIHGGAWNIPNELVQAHLDGVKHACQTGKEMLDSGGLALDVAEQIITILEDTPCFDAGYGSFLTSGGTCELDALIGDDKYGIGSVASARNIRNPIKLARAVRDKTSHVLIVGEGCQKLAQKEGIPYCPDEELLVDRELERYKEIQDGGEFVIKDAFACPSDTVGCGISD
jgi:beta-aspartyl-peptidase (threonine type)